MTVVPAAPVSIVEGVVSVRVGTPLGEVEQRLIEETLRATKGNKTLAAKLLGIDPKTLYRKLKQVEPEETPVAGSGESEEGS